MFHAGRHLSNLEKMPQKIFAPHDIGIEICIFCYKATIQLDFVRETCITIPCRENIFFVLIIN